MNQLAKSFALSACALAASLLISACGGGTLSTDTVPPTVVITDNVATPATAATGPVTFTFTFSEDVGTSFTVEDLVITNGTPGTLTKVDATHYTLVVTPVGTSGTITVSVAASKFNDLANNPNTATASISQAFNTVPVAITFSETTLKFQAFEGLISAAVADDPVLGASNQVAKMVKGPTGQPWAGATIYTSGDPVNSTSSAAHIFVDAVDLSGSKIVTMRSYTGAAVGTPITLKLEDGNNAGANIAAEALTTVQNGWETLSFNFATPTTGSYSSSTTYNTLSIFPAFSIPAVGSTAPATNTTFYFDDITYAKLVVVTPTAPATAAATPTALAANVLSIYSDAYTPIAGVNLFPGWGQSTVVSEVTIAGNKTEKYATLNYEGIDFVGNAIDVSGMSKLHIDVWTPDLTALKISLISTTTGGENAVTVTPTLAGWNSFDIDLAGYTVPDKTKIDQLKFDVQPATGTLYFDNLYFWKPAASGGGTGGTAPTTAAPTPTTAASGVLSVYSDAYTPIAGVNLNPNWGQATAVTEVTIAGNKTERYATLNYQGIDFVGNAIDVSTKGKLHIDVWTPDITALKISLISTTTGGENAVTVNPTLAGWNSFDIDLAGYTVPDKTKIDQLKFDVQPATGTLYFDNLYFWGTATAPAGGTPNPSAAAGSAGPVTLPLLTAAYLGNFGAVGNGVFAADYVGALDSNNLHAGWATATTSGLASNGNIGYFEDPAISTSAQKIDENGWVAGLIDNPPGVPSLFRYAVLTTPASAFANSYMGLYVNAPNNGTVDVSSYGNIKFRLWGPHEMYELTYHPTLEMKLTGPKVAGCSATGSGATEIKKTFLADQTIGAASTYTLSLAGWTVAGVCGTDTTSTAVASVLSKLAQVVVTVPGSSFNFTIAGSVAGQYTTGVNLGPIVFTN